MYFDKFNYGTCEFKRSQGIDISKNAIKIARKNMNKFDLNKKIKLFNRSFDQIYDKKFDLIVANLPYIKKRIKKFRRWN